MPGYEVTTTFVDLKDPQLHRYYAGDYYPRVGFYVGSERLLELSGQGNRQKTGLIREIIERPAESNSGSDSGARSQKKRGRKPNAN
jgi:hypothetical protein